MHPEQPEFFAEDDHSSFAGEVVNAPLAAEVSESFLAYSLSVITSRAIPDVRDGLKPVQRRILYSMLRMGLRPDGPHRKCARVVGDTMGNYHPHGDDSIYNSLVWMGQDFGRAVQLVDPQGNFGTLDDPPAASRYTECRLSPAAVEMLTDIDEDTVDFRPNYDGEILEPVCLPAKLPNLLVNGTSGIAVGMTTSMAPHNLREVAAAVRLIIDNPKASTKDILKVLAGPDFPSGGVVDGQGLLEAYETGQGSFKIRASAEVISVGERREAIVFSELPYQVGPEAVVSRIKEQAKDGRLGGVADVRNLSDRREGLRVQVDCHPGVDAERVLENLWNQSPVETTFRINNVALVGGVPKTLSLRELLAHYALHRLDVVEKRAKWRLKTAEQRLHICEGLLLALDNIDEVVATIRSSKTTEAARRELCKKFSMTSEQAEAVLALRLRRLVGLERQKLIDEAAELTATIEEQRALLANHKLRQELVTRELDDLADRFGRPRRTKVLPAGSFKQSLPLGQLSGEGASEVSVVTLSSSGLLGRSAQDASRRRRLGRHDLLSAVTIATPASKIWAITSLGRAVSVNLSDVPEVQMRSRGAPAAAVFSLEKDEVVRTLHAVDSGGRAPKGSKPQDDGQSTAAAEELILVTRKGAARRIATGELSGRSEDELTLLQVEPDDEVVSAFVCVPEAGVVIVSDDGMALRTQANGISARSSGAAAMRLRTGAEVVAAGAALGEAALVVVTSLGAAKSTPCEEFRLAGRGGQGVKICSLEGGERIRSAYVGPLGDTYALLAASPGKPPDNEPAPFTLPATRRGLRPTREGRAFLTVALRRW